MAQDLSNPDLTTVFATSADQDISSDDLNQLRQLNTQIEDMGGVAEGDGQSNWDDQNT